MSRGVAGLLILAGLLTGLGVRHVADRRERVRLGYELSAASAELRRVSEENRRLRLEKSVLTDPDRIERLAANLGMVRPTTDQIRVVRAGVAPPAEPTP
jgi:cell division protein FtsL